ncbi:hypothetical protein AF72_06395 [Xylella taiwanensis]|uniref:Uncharacterized protein n=1 Tax=Xylella taiwanensis TaxID=1444770 RepID=Z9JKQ9_9GAMM|nr:hypothetical protein AF72_06395 [Xylella taiwanensis]
MHGKEDIKAVAFRSAVYKADFTDLDSGGGFPDD